MADWRKQAGLIGMALLLAGCAREPDPMSLVQSPEEYGCRAAVAEAAGTRNVTLLALTRDPAGAEALFREDGSGAVWICVASDGTFEVRARGA